MSVRPLRLLGDPVLRTPCDLVVRFDDALARLVTDLPVAGHGELARVLQHECDHLAGQLYIDKLSGPERNAVLAALRRRDLDRLGPR